MTASIKETIKSFSEPANFRKVVDFLLLLIFLYFSMEIISIPQIDPLWTIFWDSHDYMEQSKAPLFSLDFLAPVPKQFFSPRPFTMPLLYKLVDSDFYRMFSFQKYFYCVCIFIVVYNILKPVKSNWLRLFFGFLLLYFFTWWNILGWSNNLLSEFCSIVFFFLWCAMLLRYYLKPGIVNAVILFLVSILFSFSRDTWSYFLLLFFILNFFVTLRQKTFLRKANLVLLLFFVIVFFLQGMAAQRGRRHVFPVLNTISMRISHNPEYLAWFEKEGFPSEQIKAHDFPHINFETNEGREKLWNRYYDTAFKKTLDWINTEGKSKYQKFLITHPSYVFLGDQRKDQTDRIYSYNHTNYYQKATKFFVNANQVFPIFNNFLFVILLLLLFFIWFKTKNTVYLLPHLLGLCLFFHVLISYNADTLEVDRHLYFTVICREFICLMALGFICEFAYEKRETIGEYARRFYKKSNKANVSAPN